MAISFPIEARGIIFGERLKDKVEAAGCYFDWRRIKTVIMKAVDDEKEYEYYAYQYEIDGKVFLSDPPHILYRLLDKQKQALVDLKEKVKGANLHFRPLLAKIIEAENEGWKIWQYKIKGKVFVSKPFRWWSED